MARIVAGKSTQLHLGNLDARRDWGHAREYVNAMWLMLQQPSPDDYVVATGELHSVREFVDMAFRIAGLEYEKYVVIDRDLYRPSEVNLLSGDASKAQRELGWNPTVHFAELVREMVVNDCVAMGVTPIDMSSQRALPESRVDCS